MNPRLHGEEEIPSRSSGGTTTVNKAGDATAQTSPPSPQNPAKGPSRPRHAVPCEVALSLGHPLGLFPWSSSTCRRPRGGGGGAQTMAIRSRRRWRRHPCRSWRPSRASHGGRPVIGGCPEIRDLGDQRNGGGQATPTGIVGQTGGGQPLLMSHRRIFDNRTNPAVHEGR